LYICKSRRSEYAFHTAPTAFKYDFRYSLSSVACERLCGTHFGSSWHRFTCYMLVPMALRREEILSITLNNLIA
jgi:hypothetical protein